MNLSTRLGVAFRMLELNAQNFIGTVAEVRRLMTVLGQFDDKATEELIAVEVKQRVATTVDELRGNLLVVGAQSAWVAADRLHTHLANDSDPISYTDLRFELGDVERRFADHLQFIKLFVMWGDQLKLLGSPVELLGEPTASRFTSVWYDCEEAAKCICLHRPTAAVFHCMRMLEIGIKAFSTRLGIPDPIKPAERNWGIFLREIKNKIDATYSSEKRMPGSEGAFMEALYCTLDAVKNPWRNEVMHVEGVYTEAEAGFILLNTVTFIQKMATGFDEKGDPVEPTMLPAA